MTKPCPTHHTPLTGGPIEYRCEKGRHRVMAADLPTQVDLKDHPLTQHLRDAA
jgi:hypothetical protein